MTLQMLLTELKESTEQMGRLRELTENKDLDLCINLRMFWDLSPDLFFITNNDGVINIVNNACMSNLHFSCEELAHKSLYELLHPDDAGMLNEVMSYVKREHVARFDMRLQNKAGYYLNLECSIAEWHNDKCFIVARPLRWVCQNCKEHRKSDTHECK